MLSDIDRKASAKIREWRNNPVKFVKENFGVEPDQWQEEVLKSFSDPTIQRIAMKACAGPGKTAVLAWCAWNFLSCYAGKGEHPKGAALAVTADNLRDNLWSELAKWRAKSKFLSFAFTWTKERVFSNEHPETWFLSARSFSKTANADEQGRSLSGLHSQYILYIIDESGDIAPAVLRSAEQGLSHTRFGKILQAGNPTSHSGILYHSCVKERSRWHVVTITGDPDDPKRSPRVDSEWAKSQISEYGRENPWVMAYVLGQFPPSSINSLLSPDEVEKSFKQNHSEDDYKFVQKKLGVDVARFGDDRTVIFPRQGLVAYSPVIIKNARSNDVAARISQAVEKWGADSILVDVTGGYGAGVEDSLLQAGITSFPVDFGGKANDNRYFNKRSELWFKMAEWVKRGGSLPTETALVSELTSPTYTFVNGKFRLEEKDQIKKRLKISPDLADALACTFSTADMPRGFNIQSWSGSRMTHEYNPFSDERMAAS